MITNRSTQAQLTQAVRVSKRKPRSQSTIGLGTHIAALAVASVVAAMAFGLPAKPIQLDNQFDPVELEVTLPLPEPEQASLYDADKAQRQDA